MEIAFPGLKNQFYLPANRIDLQHGCCLPYRGRDIGNKEIPGQQGEMGLRRRVAFFLRVLPGYPSAFIDDRLGDTRRNQTSSYTLLLPQGKSGALGVARPPSSSQLARTRGCHCPATVVKIVV